MTSQSQSITTLRGAGPALAEKLAKLDLHTVDDLLFHLPLRYEDRSRVVRIGALAPGQRVLIDARVELSETVYRGRRSLLVRVTDDTGVLTLRFFYFSNAQKSYLKRGVRVRAFGEVRRGPGGLEMVHPEYRTFTEDQASPEQDAEDTANTLTPVYPVGDGITQPRIRGLIDQALARLATDPPDELLPSGAFAAATGGHTAGGPGRAGPGVCAPVGV